MEDKRIQEEINEKEWSNRANWRFGLFYHSIRDSRTWVPKRTMFGRSRFGGTPNFARPEATTFLMVLVGIMVFLILLVIALERSGTIR